jgi:hypothetical protein
MHMLLHLFYVGHDKPWKASSDVAWKFQKVWFVKMPWEEIVFNNDYILSIVKCILCTKIGRKKNLFVLKWDYLEKRAKKKRNEYGQKIMDMKCVHANMRFSMLQWNLLLTNYNLVLCLKINESIQFASIFLLLNKGKPLIDYDSFKSLFDFWNFKRNFKIIEWLNKLEDG